MKYFWLSLFCALFVLNANAQQQQPLNGTWLGDWQNNCLQACQPSTVVITNTSATTYSVNFTFTSLQGCTGVVTQNYSDILTLTGGIWKDGKGYTASINTNNGTVLTYQFNGVGLLFTLTGSVFSKQDSLGGIGGVWLNPTPISNTSNSSVCCVPDSMYLTLADSQSRIGSTFTFTSTNCSATNSTTARLAILAPTSSSLVWSGYPNSVYNLDFAPNATLAVAVLVFNNTNNTVNCQYAYQRSNETILNNTWEQDWQSTPGSSLVNLTTYQITAVTSLNTTYMISNNTNNGTVTNSFVVQTPSGAYYDSFLNAGNGATFTYSQPTNTLLDSNDSLLLSPNGSVLSNTPFIGSWSTAIALSNNSLPEGCCVPTQINISANGATESPLNVLYQLPSNYNDILGCGDLITAVDASGVINSTLIRSGPISLTTLTWYDNSFNNTFIGIDGSQLTIQNLTLGCGFSMSLGGANPNPSPLSSSIVSTGIISLVMGLFMLAF